MIPEKDGTRARTFLPGQKYHPCRTHQHKGRQLEAACLFFLNRRTIREPVEPMPRESRPRSLPAGAETLSEAPDIPEFGHVRMIKRIACIVCCKHRRDLFSLPVNRRKAGLA